MDEFMYRYKNSHLPITCRLVNYFNFSPKPEFPAIDYSTTSPYRTHLKIGLPPISALV